MMAFIEINRTILAIILGLLLLSGTPVLAQQFDPDHLVVEMEEGFDIEIVNSQFGTTTAQYLNQLDVYLVNAISGMELIVLAEQINGLVEVKDCHPNFLTDPMQAVQGSLPISDLVPGEEYTTQPALAAIALPQAHQIATGAGVKVAVIDGGINYAHPAFEGRAVSGYDYVDNDNDAFDEAGGINSGHGTFVAGVIHLVAPDAQIVAYRVCDTAGQSNGYLVAEAMLQALADGCRVINISMVMYGQHAAIRRAINHCYRNQCLTVVASGNDNDTIPLYPASDGLALTVAALDSGDVIADFSGYGTHIDVCAPGVEICAPYNSESFARWSGTSFAAPFASGQAALITAYEPAYSAFHVKGCIVGSGVNIDAVNPSLTGLSGSGRIDPVASFSYDPVWCGDVDGSGSLDISDAVGFMYYLVGLENCDDGSLAQPTISAPWLAAAEVDTIPGIDMGDFAYLWDFLFSGGPWPCADTQSLTETLAGSVTVDLVAGAAGYNSLAIGQPITFRFQIQNSSESDIRFLSNGFTLYSPDGADWESHTVQSEEGDIEIGAGQVHFTSSSEDPLLEGLMQSGCEVADADRFGLVSLSFWGIPPGHGGDFYYLSIGSFGPDDIGKTIVLDTSSFGNAGSWEWLANGWTRVIPSWDGPFSFTIEEPDYQPGDADNSGTVDLSDLTFIVAYLFNGGAAPATPEACDVDGNCNIINIADLTYLVNFLFLNGDSPYYACSRPGF